MTPLRFEAEIVAWRGPAPFYFAQIPEELTGEIKEAARIASYGWGAVPVEVEIAGQAFSTSLFPRDGSYMLPLKDMIRHRIGATIGDIIGISLIVRARSR